VSYCVTQSSAEVDLLRRPQGTGRRAKSIGQRAEGRKQKAESSQKRIRYLNRYEGRVERSNDG
jgi:hypothetical protein